MTVAYHEAGHALIALVIEGADPLKKVTIIPRGRSLGVTEQLPEEDRHNYSRSYLFARLCIMLGGRAAEKLIYEETTSGAGDDLKKATDLARRMVCQWGMSEKLGAAVFSRGDSHPFLGQELAHEKNFSEETARIIDAKIIALLNDAQKTALDVLLKNSAQLKKLAHELFEHETLSEKQVSEILPKQELTGPEKLTNSQKLAEKKERRKSEK